PPVPTSPTKQQPETIPSRKSSRKRINKTSLTIQRAHHHNTQHQHQPTPSTTTLTHSINFNLLHLFKPFQSQTPNPHPTSKMHASTIFTALFAAAAMAAPSPSPANTNNAAALISRDPNVAEVQAAAKTAMDAKVAAGCNYVKCVIALAPASAVCAAAAAEGGVNIVADIACFAAALDISANPPAACKGC
ncbi:hypothetical protein CC80DRAFT_14194, partial [Byssothecium circinans]